MKNDDENQDISKTVNNKFQQKTEQKPTQFYRDFFSISDNESIYRTLDNNAISTSKSPTNNQFINTMLLNLLPEANPIVRKNFDLPEPVKTAYQFKMQQLPEKQGDPPQTQLLYQNDMTSSTLYNSNKSQKEASNFSKNNQTAYAYFGPGTSAPRHFRSILKDEKQIVYRRFIDTNDPTNYTRLVCNLANLIESNNNNNNTNSIYGAQNEMTTGVQSQLGQAFPLTDQISNNKQQIIASTNLNSYKIIGDASNNNRVASQNQENQTTFSGFSINDNINNVYGDRNNQESQINQKKTEDAIIEKQFLMQLVQEKSRIQGIFNDQQISQQMANASQLNKVEFLEEYSSDDDRIVAAQEQDAQEADQENEKQELKKQTLGKADAQNSIKKEPFTLQFESKFQSGNLALACKADDQQYNLLLQDDINTRGYSQWFYFRVEGAKIERTVKFNILNMSNAGSLFNEGMQVMVYSENQFKQKGLGWHRDCSQISYYRNSFCQSSSDFNNNFYTLSFKYTFASEGDQVYFAYSQPYTYSELTKFLDQSEQNPQYQNIFHRKLLCRTIAGNRVDVLTITNNFLKKSKENQDGASTKNIDNTPENEDSRGLVVQSNSQISSSAFEDVKLTKQQNNLGISSGEIDGATSSQKKIEIDKSTEKLKNENNGEANGTESQVGGNRPSHQQQDLQELEKIRKQKQGIVISARVHPGETVSSFIIKGIIDFLLSDDPQAVQLRDKFIFKLIPMLNPDGVIHGNYRCSLAGRDLNRRWRDPCEIMFPEIYYSKQMITEFSARNELAMYIDLHGHSRKKNIFFYGCHQKGNPLACRQFPFLISQFNQENYYSYGDCNFAIQAYQQGTARITLWRELKISNIFTLESSFCGPSKNNIHFTAIDLAKAGKSLCEAFLVYFSEKPGTPQNRMLVSSVGISPQIQSKSKHNQKRNNNNSVSQNKTDSTFSVGPGSPVSQILLSNENHLIVHSQQNSIIQDQIYHNNSEINANMFPGFSKYQIQRAQILAELYENVQYQKMGMNKDDSGSESNPSQDNLSESELQTILPINNRKKKSDGANPANKKLLKKKSRQYDGSNPNNNSSFNATQKTFDINYKNRDRGKESLRLDDQQPLSLSGSKSALKTQSIKSGKECFSPDVDQTQIYKDRDLTRVSSKVYNFIVNEKKCRQCYRRVYKNLGCNCNLDENDQSQPNGNRISILEPQFINFPSQYPHVYMERSKFHNRGSQDRSAQQRGYLGLSSFLVPGDQAKNSYVATAFNPSSNNNMGPFNPFPKQNSSNMPQMLYGQLAGRRLPYGPNQSNFTALAFPTDNSQYGNLATLVDQKTGMNNRSANTRIIKVTKQGINYNQFQDEGSGPSITNTVFLNHHQQSSLSQTFYQDNASSINYYTTINNGISNLNTNSYNVTNNNNNNHFYRVIQSKQHSPSHNSNLNQQQQPLAEKIIPVGTAKNYIKTQNNFYDQNSLTIIEELNNNVNTTTENQTDPNEGNTDLIRSKFENLIVGPKGENTTGENNMTLNKYCQMKNYSTLNNNSETLEQCESRIVIKESEKFRLTTISKQTRSKSNEVPQITKDQNPFNYTSNLVFKKLKGMNKAALLQRQMGYHSGEKTFNPTHPNNLISISQKERKVKDNGVEDQLITNIFPSAEASPIKNSSVAYKKGRSASSSQKTTLFNMQKKTSVNQVPVSAVAAMAYGKAIALNASTLGVEIPSRNQGTSLNSSILVKGQLESQQILVSRRISPEKDSSRGGPEHLRLIQQENLELNNNENMDTSKEKNRRDGPNTLKNPNSNFDYSVQIENQSFLVYNCLSTVGQGIAPQKQKHCQNSKKKIIKVVNVKDLQNIQNSPNKKEANQTIGI